MANHGYVKTKRPMKPEAIADLLDKLNKKRFKNKLTIEYYHSPNDPKASGEHCWIIEYNGSRRVFWLNTTRSFEISHGGSGGDFMWWIDSSILNQIAIQFKGRISDDGVGGTWAGKRGKFQTFTDYVDAMTAHIKNKKQRKICRSLRLEFAPTEFTK